MEFESSSLKYTFAVEEFKYNNVFSELTISRGVVGLDVPIPTLPSSSIVNLSKAVSPFLFVCITNLPPEPASVLTFILAKTSAALAFLKCNAGVSSTSIVISQLVIVLPKSVVPDTLKLVSVPMLVMFV